MRCEYRTVMCDGISQIRCGRGHVNCGDTLVEVVRHLFHIEHVQNNMYHLHLDDLSRSNGVKGRVAGMVSP